VLVEIANPEVLIDFIRQSLRPKFRYVKKDKKGPWPTRFDHQKALELIASGKSYTEVGEALGCTRERIRQIDKKYTGLSAYERNNEPFVPIDGEEWRMTPLAPAYIRVSNFGRVLDHEAQLILVPFQNSKGYQSVPSGTVHELVLSAFVGRRPKGYHINHKDFNPANNRLENLEYCTRRQNLHHSMKAGRFNKAWKSFHALPDQEVHRLLEARQKGIAYWRLGEMFGITAMTAHRIVKNKGYKVK
jgi:hypothetical protein